MSLHNNCPVSFPHKSLAQSSKSWSPAVREGRAGSKLDRTDTQGRVHLLATLWTSSLIWTPSFNGPFYLKLILDSSFNEPPYA